MEKSPRSKKLKATVDESKCYGCGLCAIVCQQEAIVVRVAQPLPA
jgi:Fe-S-cluster-containing hydrogenase component 2